MLKKITALTVCILLISFSQAMDVASKNIISEQIIYTEHAYERMVERQVTHDEVMRVLHTGYREWDLADRGAERFVERKSSNPLIVVLDRKSQPNIVVTIIRADTQPTRLIRKFTAGRLKEEEYVKEQRSKKGKDFKRQR